MNIKVWINAFRLRTLPLALSSILMGIASAKIFGIFDLRVSIWALITTTLLQILSNLANDYGDGIKGTDNEKRLGPLRTVQSGKISPKQMKSAIFIFSAISFFSGLYLLYLSQLTYKEIAAFILVGVSSIIAAIKYTVGNKAYGYQGFGDLFVFVFFGLIAVLGSFYLITNKVYLLVFLPAISVGLLSTAVLNLNNMRDIENDNLMGKKTIAVRLGIKNSKLYHTFIINIAFLLLLGFSVIQELDWYVYLSFLIYILFLIDLNKIEKINKLDQLDPFLKKTALKTFLFISLYTILVFL